METGQVATTTLRIEQGRAWRNRPLSTVDRKEHYPIRNGVGAFCRPEAVLNLGCFVVVKECSHLTLVFPGEKSCPLSKE